MDDNSPSRIGHGLWRTYRRILDTCDAKFDNVLASRAPDRQRSAAGRLFDQQSKRKGLRRRTPRDRMHPLKIEVRPRRRVVAASIAAIEDEDMEPRQSVPHVKERHVSQ